MTSDNKLTEKTMVLVEDFAKALGKVLPADENAMLQMMLPEYLPQIRAAIENHPTVTRLILKQVRSRIDEALEE